MTIFENFTKRVTETAKAAAKKSSDLVEVTKLNMSIGSEEEKIEKACAEIGKIVYTSFSKGEDVGGAFWEICEKIKSYEESIKDMKQKILDMKNVKICPACAAELEVEIAFCPKCGAKQEIPQPPAEPAEPVGPVEKTCAACGAIHLQEDTFCSKCGNKL